MTLRNPIGQHKQNVKSVDENWFVDQCQKAKYTTVTILDAAAFAGRVQSEGGVPYTIFRDSGFEPDPKQDDDAYIQKYAKGVYDQVRQKVAECGNPNVHIMVNCEQGHSVARIKMYTELIRLSATDAHGPVGMVFLNTFIGSIKTGFWGQENEFERPDMLEFIRVFDQYRNIRLASGSYAFVLGVHNYTSQYAWIAVNAGEHRIPSWDVADRIRIDWNKAQDHLGREYQGIRKALGWLWNSVTGKWYSTEKTKTRPNGTPVEPPWIIITEALIDAVGGVPVQATHIDSNPTPYGYHTMKTQWEQVWFKEDNGHGKTLGRMSIWVWKTLIGNEGYFIGLNNYTVGNTGTWQTHNTARKDHTDGDADPDMDYFNTIQPYRFDMPAHFFAAQAVPTPPTPPPPADPKPPPPTALYVLGLTAAEQARVLQLLAQIDGARAVIADADNALRVLMEDAQRRYQQETLKKVS